LPQRIPRTGKQIREAEVKNYENIRRVYFDFSQISVSDIICSEDWVEVHTWFPGLQPLFHSPSPEVA